MNRFELREQLRARAARALERLDELLESDNERVALQASRLVLEGAFVAVPKHELVDDAAFDRESFEHRVASEVDNQKYFGHRPKLTTPALAAKMLAELEADDE